MKTIWQATLFFCAIYNLCAEEIRSFEFHVYGQYPVREVGYRPVSEAAVASGEKEEPIQSIKTHNLARTGPYSFKGGDLVTFFNLETQRPVGRVKVPDSSARWLFVFVRNPRHRENPEGQLQYLIYPFDESMSNLPKDSLVFLNISGKEMDGLIEKKRVKIEHGESDSFSIQESLPINLWTRDFSGKKLLPALIKTYHFEPDHRYLIILFPPVLRGSADLDVRFLSDRADRPS